MDDSDLLAFTPVPVRARADGWTPKKQYFFILGLARGFTPARAAALLGMTRKTAYELRRKPGAEGFARAWDAAVARARERRIAARGPSLAERALHGEWHPRLYHGRLIGWTHRPANARAMGLLKRLDRQIERLPPGTDAGISTPVSTSSAPNVTVRTKIHASGVILVTFRPIARPRKIGRLPLCPALPWNSNSPPRPRSAWSRSAVRRRWSIPSGS